jgi:hypothetical protein
MQSDKNATIPKSPDLEVLRSYVEDNIGGPDRSSILLDWSQPLSASSLWNWDTITMLAEALRVKLIASEIKYKESWLEIPSLMKAIVTSLKQTKMTMSKLSAGADIDKACRSSGVHGRQHARVQAVRTCAEVFIATH